MSRGREGVFNLARRKAARERAQVSHAGTLAFDPICDFKSIGEIADVPIALVARRNLSPKYLSELLSHLEEQANKIKIGNAGVGSASNVCALLFIRSTGEFIQRFSRR